MLGRHNRIVVFAVVICLFIGIVIPSAPGVVDDADAATDNTQQFQQTASNGSNASRNESAASNASVTFKNQTITGTTVTIRSVTLPANGFVAIHNGSYRSLENESVDSIIGVSRYLDAGRNENVTVVFRNVRRSNGTLTAVVHRDGNGNGNFDYATASGFVDTAFGVNGTPVSDSAVVTVQRIPPSAVGDGFESRPASPAVTVTNQTLINDRISVDSVEMPTYSYVVVHNGSYNASSPSAATIIGRTQQVRVGRFRNVTIELYDVPGRNFSRSRINETGRVYVSLYRDTNRNGEFEFRNLSDGTDAPYLNESGVPIVTRVRVNVTNATGGTTATARSERTPTPGASETMVEGDEGRRETTDRSGGEAQTDSGGTDAGGEGSDIPAGLSLIGGIVAVVVIGLFVVRAKDSGRYGVGPLGQELARIRMAVSRYVIDMRAYGIPADWQTLEIDLSEDDSAERQSAVEAFATVEGLDVTPADGWTPSDGGDDEPVHRNVTISLSRETVERAETAAAEGDERSKEVVTALRRVLSAYSPDAVRLPTDAHEKS